MRVTLYTKPECPLCDECKADLRALQSEFGFVLEERSILDDPEFFARFQFLIPVVDIDGGPLLYPPHDWLTLRHTLVAAQAQAEGHHGAASA